MTVKVNSKKMMKDVEKSFAFSISGLHQMVLDFHEEMRRGLNDEPSSLMMLPGKNDFGDVSWRTYPVSHYGLCWR